MIEIVLEAANQVVVLSLSSTIFFNANQRNFWVALIGRIHSLSKVSFSRALNNMIET